MRRIFDGSLITFSKRFQRRSYGLMNSINFRGKIILQNECVNLCNFSCILSFFEFFVLFKYFLKICNSFTESELYTCI